MHTTLSHLSDIELVEALKRLVRSGRDGGSLLITHLGEVDDRRLVLGLGFPSLFVYCTEVLHLSEHEAYHRILAARTAKRFPRVLEMLGDGSLNLTTVRLLAGHLTDDNHAELLAAAAHKTRRQVEVLVAGRFPRPDAPSLIRKLPAVLRPGLPAAAIAPASVTTIAPATTTITPLPAPASAPMAAPRPMVRPLSSDGYLIRFTAKARTYEKLSDAKDLLRHAVPTGDLDEIFDRALTALLADLAPRSSPPPTGPGRPQLGPGRVPPYHVQMTRIGLLWLVATLLAAARTALAGPSPPLIRHDATRMSMAAPYAIVAYGADAPALAAAADAALDEVDRIDRLMSHYKPDSPLSQVNGQAGAGPVRVDPELFDFLAECLRYSRESGGAFDVTVGPLMKAWGFFRGEGRLPGQGELEQARGRIGYQHVVLDHAQRTVRFDRPGMELDLGGIAKGYAVDRAVAVLRAHHVPAALVSAGGSTVYGLGAPPGREAWEVTVQDPIAASRTAFTVRLRDRALSVSGTHEKSFEVGGVTYSHVMDPRTGRPAPDVLGVAVLADTGTAGDALDNALFVQGVTEARASVARMKDTEAFFFLPARGRPWKMVHLTGRVPTRPTTAQGAVERSTTP